MLAYRSWGHVTILLMKEEKTVNHERRRGVDILPTSPSEILK